MQTGGCKKYKLKNMIQTNCTKCGRTISFTGNGGWAGEILWCNCPRETSTQTVTSTSSMKPCNHHNGFYKTLYFKWLFLEFKESYFVCTDCRDVFETRRIIK